MFRKTFVSVLCAGAFVVIAFSSGAGAAADDTRIAEAAMAGDRAAVLSLVKQGADVNVAQGDGMTALHWAAMKDDLEMAKALIGGGAKLNAFTRIDRQTPVFFAAKNGNAQMLIALIFAGADAKARTTTGLTPLMVASAGGNPEAVKVLVGFGGDLNLKESTLGQTALMFAASFNRSEAVRILMEHGADPKMASRVIDMAAQAARGGGGGGGGGRTGGGGAGAAGAAGAGRAAAPPATAATAQAVASGLAGATTVGGGAADPAQAAAGRGRGGRGGGGAGAGQDQGGGNNGDDSRPTVIDFQGGLTPLLFAARQGNLDAVRALVECGANVNFPSPGDKSSPLLIAAINGHFDVAMYLLGKGADPNQTSTANTTPLYAVLNVQYAPHAFYPQPSPARERTTYLELMHALLERGAEPNVKLRNKLWFTGYNFDQSGVDAMGSTAFWRAAQAADIAAMKMLIDYGADPKISSDGGGARAGNGRGPGADAAEARVATKIVQGVTPLQMASGAGYDGNFQVIAPGGFLPALKYILEVLGGDVNEADSRGYTPVHNAAFRGDNEMILYLVSKGADVKLETKSGETSVDLANGPVQRLQPFPETIKLLEGMGVKNNHKCKSCG